MELNVYEKGKVKKTYEADSYDLMFGTIEDVAEAIKLDELKTGSQEEILKIVMNLAVTSMGTLRELMKDVFPGISDEELKKTKVKEIAVVLIEVVTFTIKQLNINFNSKN